MVLSVVARSFFSQTRMVAYYPPKAPLADQAKRKPWPHYGSKHVKAMTMVAGKLHCFSNSTFRAALSKCQHMSEWINKLRRVPSRSIS